MAFCIYSVQLTVIYALLVQVNETMLRSIVTYPETDYFFINNFSKLTNIIDSFIVQACRILPPAPCKLNTGHGTAHVEISTLL